MKWLFAIIFPPMALILCGKPIQAVLNFALCLFFWLPGVAHALLVVFDTRAEQRAAAAVNLRIG